MKFTTPSEEALQVEEIKSAHEVFISRQTKRETIKELGDLLKNNPGGDAVAINITTPTGMEKKLLPYKVNWTPQLDEKIKNLLGS
ncbi:MAG: hypothetical protein LBG64_03475, partial [Pseudomonadales bacterium]|jgi:hypothetical protein|nr:hypothetical protein [Pseudomonadales bacterium]